MYRNVPKNIFHNVWKCTEKTISKAIWVGKRALDVILSQINKKIGDRFHFQWYRRRLNYQFCNYVTDKVNGSRVQPSLFGEDQRPDPGDGGNRAYLLFVFYANATWKKIMNGKQNYLLGCRWNMGASGAFGVTLRLSSFGGSIWLLWSSTQPQGRIIERANPLKGHKLAQKPHRTKETHNLTEVH